MSRQRAKYAPVNVPIANPTFGVQPVTYYMDPVWNYTGPRQATRSRSALQYRVSDVSERSRRPHVTAAQYYYPTAPEFQNHIRYQPKPQPVQRSKSADRMQNVEKMVERQEILRKDIRETIGRWKTVVKDLQKVGKKCSVDQQMRQIRGVCGNIDQFSSKWKTQIHQLTGVPFDSKGKNSTPSSALDQSLASNQTNHSDLMESLHKQKLLNESRADEIKSLQQQQQEIEKENNALKTKIKNQQEDLAKVIQEKEESLTRLSEVAGSKLTDGNVNFTELNTENRPTKIAERFREIYNNEWMEAMEVLSKDDPVAEKKSIATLLYIVKATYEYCESERDSMNERLVAALCGDVQTSSKIDNESKRLIKQLQKSTISLLSSSIADKFCQSLDVDENFEHPIPEKLKTFAAECTRTTWCMVVQSPPMHIHCDGAHGKEYDHAMFSEYTKSGKTLDFVVWPAVQIEKGGSLLSKGVVQPLKDP